MADADSSDNALPDVHEPRISSSPLKTRVCLDETGLSCDDGVVISGISCRLPKSNNMTKFARNLIDGVEMITSKNDESEDTRFCERRWGVLGDMDKFDASFFNIPPDQVNVMDPQLRLLIELTTEAMIDAGIEPDTTCGSNTGVFIGAGESHAREAYGTDPDKPNTNVIDGCSTNMFANRISVIYDFRGPSYSVLGSDAASSLALDRAYQSIQLGEVDKAIVGGASICFKHATNKQYSEAGLATRTGCSFCGGDGVTVLLLQKPKSAKRVYATIVHSSSQISKPSKPGMSYPSAENQQAFLEKFYTDIGLDGDEACKEYVETHGVGDSTSDTDELQALDAAMCASRDSPLNIGSLSSSTGYLRAVSGLASVAKVLVAMEKGMIPATQNYSNPHPDIPALRNGSVEVVSENTRMLDGLSAVNNLGTGGYHVHTLLMANEKTRALHYMASQAVRLCVYQGVTAEGTEKVLKFMLEHGGDFELHSLLNETSMMSAEKYPYRGYCLLNSRSPTIHRQVCPTDACDRPVWYIFPGMGTQWSGMGRSLLQLDGFRRSILECGDVLKQYDMNLYKMITEGAENVYETPLNSFVTITAIQIALVNLLLDMGVGADGIIGHSSGEIVCGYADGCLTAREAMLTAYWRGYSIQETNMPPGAMAAVGLTWEEARKQCPDGVTPACHNCENTVTISGSVDEVHSFLLHLAEREVYTHELKCDGVAFHTAVMNQVVPAFREHLEQIIEQKPRTHRWVSTSVPESEWDTPIAQTCSIDYLANNLVSPVLFQEALKHVPNNAIVLEIGPHDVLQTILKKSLHKDAFHIGLMQREHNNVEHFFESLGKCYMNGLNFNPLGVFPAVEFPVPRGTPMLSALVDWDHAHSWDIPESQNFLTGGHGQLHQSRFNIVTKHDGKGHHLVGHVINGWPVFPVAGYLVLAWKCLARYLGQFYETMPVVLENIQVHRPTLLPRKGCVTFDVSMIPLVGWFEIVEGGELVCTGRVSRQATPTQDWQDTPSSPFKKPEIQMTMDEVYTELSHRGHEYAGVFKSILQSENNGSSGIVKWSCDWVTFLDGMLQMYILSHAGSSLQQVTNMTSISIHPAIHTDNIKHGTATVTVDRTCNTVSAGGVRMEGLVSMVTHILERSVTANVKSDIEPLHETIAACVKVKGQPPRASWVTSRLIYPTHLSHDPDYVLCYPRYCQISDQDVKTVRGCGYLHERGVVSRSRAGPKEIGIGMEFSGYDHHGKRVMGFVKEHGLSTMLYAEKRHVWAFPDSWVMLDACTVPLSYLQAYYALCVRADLNKTQSVLVVGSGSASQAAINVAMHHGSTTFVAVESREQKNKLMFTFDSLRSSIFIIDDVCAEVLRSTKGQGVDVVVNYIKGANEEVDVLVKKGGSYLQCYSPDKEPSNPMSFDVLQQNVKLCHIQLQYLDRDNVEVVSDLITQGLRDGVVKPLSLEVFSRDNIDQAVSYKHKHPHKDVAIKIGDECLIGPVNMMAEKRVLFAPHKCYIVINGLGELGYQLVDWIILRGATKLLLTAAKGAETGYDRRKMREWTDMGAMVTVSHRDITSLHDTRELIADAKKHGPVGGMFVLEQICSSSTDDIDDSVHHQGIANLDQVTRTVSNKTLDWFIVLPSSNQRLECGDKICHQRTKDNLPGLSVKLGSKVGSVPEVCLSQLELSMLHGKPTVYPPTGDSSQHGQTLLEQQICRATGLTSLTSVPGCTSLRELGADTLVAMEIKHILEEHSYMIFTTEEVKNLTVEEILDMNEIPLAAEEDLKSAEADKIKTVKDEITQLADPVTVLHTLPTMDSLQLIVKLNSVSGLGLPVYIVYGAEDEREIMALVNQVTYPVYGIRTIPDVPLESTQTHAGYIIQTIFVNNNAEQMILIGHKFGCPVAIEMTLQLQADDLDLVSQLVCVEGSHKYIPYTKTDFLYREDADGTEEIYQEAILSCISLYMDLTERVIDTIDSFSNDDSLEDRVASLLPHVMMGDRVTALGLSEAQVELQMHMFIKQYRNTCLYTPTPGAYKGQTTLIRGRQQQKGMKIPGDYLLSKVCHGEVSVHILNTESDNFLQEMREDIVTTINAVANKVKDENKVKVTNAESH